MKKMLLLPLFLFGSMTVSKAQAPVTSALETKNGPVMTFDELEFNYGTIKQGESVTHEFKFKNTGKEPLIIATAQGSCGCTVPDYPKEPIKPNGTGLIKVTFNSAGKMGAQDKTVTITYGTGQQVVLHIKGNVEAPAATPAPQTPVAAPQNGSTTPAAPKGTSTTTATPATGKATVAPTSTAAPKAAAAPATQPKIISAGPPTEKPKN